MRLYQLQSVEEVLALIKTSFSSLSQEKVNIMEALGRVTAAAIISPEDVPAFPRSTVDGYAVRAMDTYGAGESIPAMLEKTGQVAMGRPAPVLLSGAAVYVPTGGMLPPGADAVVMIEDVELLDDLVNCYRQVAPGDNVIQKGEDIFYGREVIPRGRYLRSQEIGLLAALGIEEISVTRQPLVGILSSGDEVTPWQTTALELGKVRDSNGPALMAMVRQQGGLPVYGGIIEDDYDTLQKKALDLLAEVDFLVLSGGSSVGSRDHTARLLREMNQDGLLVEGIAMQPGKPTLLSHYQGKPVLGLPGHPVAALNVFTLVGNMILNVLEGKEEENWQPYITAILTCNIASKPGRTDYIRMKLQKTADGKISATPIFGRSGLLSTLVEANGILTVEPGLEGILAGTPVKVALCQ